MSDEEPIDHRRLVTELARREAAKIPPTAWWQLVVLGVAWGVLLVLPVWWVWHTWGDDAGAVALLWALLVAWILEVWTFHSPENWLDRLVHRLWPHRQPNVDGGSRKQQDQILTQHVKLKDPPG